MHKKDFAITDDSQMKSSQGIILYLIQKTKTCLCLW